MTPAGGSTGSSVAAYKAAAGATIDEYFASGEAGEVVRRLVELDEPALANMFVKQVRTTPTRPPPSPTIARPCSSDDGQTHVSTHVSCELSWIQTKA